MPNDDRPKPVSPGDGLLEAEELGLPLILDVGDSLTEALGLSDKDPEIDALGELLILVDGEDDGLAEILTEGDDEMLVDGLLLGEFDIDVDGLEDTELLTDADILALIEADTETEGLLLGELEGELDGLLLGELDIDTDGLDEIDVDGLLLGELDGLLLGDVDTKVTLKKSTFKIVSNEPLAEGELEIEVLGLEDIL